MLKIRVELEYDPDAKAWSTVCPELPGCVSQGDTEAEVIQNVKEAIGLHLDPGKSCERQTGAKEVFLEYAENL